MVAKDEVLSEIRCLANKNGGFPVEKSRFLAETGIRELDWLGRYLTRWRDAQGKVGVIAPLL